MRAVIQRVTRASVTVEGHRVGAIGPGLLVLLGIAAGDTEKEARWLAHKTANLRIFSDAEGKMNLSVQDIQGGVLVISQFTLHGDIRRGFRPSFTQAAPSEIAEPLVAQYCEALREALRELQLPVETGIFGAHMEVELVNDGPVTLILEKEPASTP
ncbi:MAG TPA: D-aminoacyl-tRNA deacylase [Anaerolineae bacterium]|nr:D-aminoacyl-tRNA deacylase [Anaerolineae bacterium]HRT31452.1 D-aminoacyl-tRNA deacylase [Anaerolineae bacterium]HXK43449.1 D-aminoacyl-tRNA deacylase [Anaerolineae bacterium]